jgi:brefeldin A-inhibited guanine nucleotide-exchange protein
MPVFCLKVLHAYVGQMDFRAYPFDIAIRHFLRGFRLPGEAQKIDRIMETFAERYYLQNRDVFASADMAFILAFSTIMLQTNLHNPAIKEEKKMTREQWIKQNTGISTDGELSAELLSQIYDRIAAEPISITQDAKVNKERNRSEDNSGFTVFQSTIDKRRMSAFDDERKEMLKESTHHPLFLYNVSTTVLLIVLWMVMSVLTEPHFSFFFLTIHSPLLHSFPIS